MFNRFFLFNSTGYFSIGFDRLTIKMTRQFFRVFEQKPRKNEIFVQKIIFGIQKQEKSRNRRICNINRSSVA